MENRRLINTASTPLMGIKNQHMMAKREKAREIELAKKTAM